MRRVAVGLIRAYQRGISPYMPPSCLFSPVCSQYAVEAYRRHGALKGTILTAWRIARCNPLSRGGLDPTPAPGLWRNPPPVPTAGEHEIR